MDVPRERPECALVAVDERGLIRAFSPVAESWLHLAAGDVLHQPLQRLPAALQQAIRDTFELGRAVADRQLAVADREQENRRLRIGTTPLYDASNHRCGVIAVLEDVTATLPYARKVHQLDRLASIGTLAASMAHEIRNALVPVRTFVDLLLQQNKDAELAEVVKRELRRVESLVSQMLRFAGPAKPTFAPVRIQDVLDQALHLVQHQLEGRQLHLHKSFQAGTATIRGDTYQLEQALLNLFFNAIEAMAPAGHLQVNTEVLAPAQFALKETGPTASDYVRIQVADTGVGVPPENLERVFEPFFTTKPQGTGLGLTITRRIIAEHNGRILVESELNKGTTFSLLLPVATERAKDAAMTG